MRVRPLPDGGGRTARAGRTAGTARRLTAVADVSPRVTASGPTTGCSGSSIVIVPAGYAPPVPAQLVLRSGPYWLWTIPNAGCVQIGRTDGELVANRTNVG